MGIERWPCGCHAPVACEASQSCRFQDCQHAAKGKALVREMREVAVLVSGLDGEKVPSSHEPTFDEGWQAHALSQPLPADAPEEFMLGWIQRYREGRPTLVFAAPGQDPVVLAQLADRIDL